MNRRSFLSNLLAAALAPALRFLPAPGKVEASVRSTSPAVPADCTWYCWNRGRSASGRTVDGLKLLSSVAFGGSSMEFNPPLVLTGSGKLIVSLWNVVPEVVVFVDDENFPGGDPNWLTTVARFGRDPKLYRLDRPVVTDHYGSIIMDDQTS